MAFVTIPLDIDQLVRLYTSGESAENLAHRFGVSSATILRRLHARGVPVRQGPSYRTVDTETVKQRRARTRSKMGLHIGPHEREFAAALDASGLHYRQQPPIGHYNLDFALDEAPIAVEIVSGGGNSRSAAHRRERIEFVLERGLWVIEVHVRYGNQFRPISSGSAEYVHALAQRLRGKPTCRGEHRMIWADGQVMTPRRRQVY